MTLIVAKGSQAAGTLPSALEEEGSVLLVEGRAQLVRQELMRRQGRLQVLGVAAKDRPGTGFVPTPNLEPAPAAS